MQSHNILKFIAEGFPLKAIQSKCIANFHSRCLTLKSYQNHCHEHLTLYPRYGDAFTTAVTTTTQHNTQGRCVTSFVCLLLTLTWTQLCSWRKGSHRMMSCSKVCSGLITKNVPVISMAYYLYLKEMEMFKCMDILKASVQNLNPICDPICDQHIMKQVNMYYHWNPTLLL